MEKIATDIYSFENLRRSELFKGLKFEKKRWVWMRRK